VFVKALSLGSKRYDKDFTDITVFFGCVSCLGATAALWNTGKFHGKSYENGGGALLQDLRLDFARDPQTGLNSAGWDSFKAAKAVFLGDVDLPMKVIEL
jgi:hypothetical protein